MLLQAEQIVEVVIIQVVEVVILSENSGHYVSCSTCKNSNLFLSLR